MSLKMLAAGCSGERLGFISPDLSSDPTVIGSYGANDQKPALVDRARAAIDSASSAVTPYRTIAVLCDAS